MRSKIEDSLPRISWGFFFLTLALLPFRFKVAQFPRPVVPIWADYTDFILYLTDLTLLAAIVFWAVFIILKREKVKKGPAFLFYPLCGLTLVSFVTAATSVDPGLSFYHAVRLTILLGFFIYVLNNVSSLRQLFFPLAIMLASQSVIAIAQALTQHSVGLQALGEFELDPAWHGVSVVWSDTLRSLRAYGLSDHPNILGGILALGLIYLIGSWLGKGSGDLTYSGPIAVGLLGLFLTFSRSAWLGFAVGLMFLIYHRFLKTRTRPTHAHLIFATCVLLLLLPFVWINIELLGVRLGERISFSEIQPELGSMGERRVLAAAGNSMFSENAIFGVGLGASPQAIRNEFPDFPVNYAPPHNVLASAALETGLLGAVFYLILLTAPWVAFLLRKKPLSLGLATVSAALVCFTIIGFFDVHPWLVQSGRISQYLIWGIWGRFFENWRH